MFDNTLNGFKEVGNGILNDISDIKRTIRCRAYSKILDYEKKRKENEEFNLYDMVDMELEILNNIETRAN